MKKREKERWGGGRKKDSENILLDFLKLTADIILIFRDKTSLIENLDKYHLVFSATHSDVVNTTLEIRFSNDSQSCDQG